MHLSNYVAEWVTAIRSFSNFYRTLTASIFILISSVIPAITFASFLAEKTGGQYGVIEVLFSTGMSGMVYSICSGQPLVIVGVTGPISIFSRSIYQITSSMDLSFLTFMFWVGIWASVFHVAIGLLGYCDAVKYVTRYTHETFGALIAVVYFFTAIAETVDGFNSNPLSASLLAVILTLGTFLFSEWFTLARHSSLYGVAFRTVVADYSLIIALVIMTVMPRLLPLAPNNINLPALSVASNFSPSNGRQSWFVDPLLNPTWTIFASIPAAMLLTILIFFDHNVASMIAQDPKFGLKKPPTYNWDFIVVGLSMVLTSIIGLPPTHGLLPQAPLHTVHLAKFHEESKIDIRTGHQITRKVYSEVLEQRLSNMLQSSITFAIVFAPAILFILGLIPISVLNGTFLVLAFQSLHGNTFYERAFIMLFVTDTSLRTRAAPHCWPGLERDLLTNAPRKAHILPKIFIFTGTQLMFLIVIFCVMEVAPAFVALTFPIFITAMVAMPFVFTGKCLGSYSFSKAELCALDEEVENANGDEGEDEIGASRSSGVIVESMEMVENA